MHSLILPLWDLAVLVAAFGTGAVTLRLARIGRQALAVTGIVGVATWIAIGGWLNLAHLLRREVLVGLIVAGVLAAALCWKEIVPPPRVDSEAEPGDPVGTVALWCALGLLGVIAAAGAHSIEWNFDDLQGYMAMALKALQTHAIQPDFFCERRVQAGVGGANFLDTLALASGQFRALRFTDSGLGYLLYALAILAVGQRLHLRRRALALLLLLVPFLSLMKVNLTIVYLSAAALLVLLLLVLDFIPAEPQPFGHAAIAGLVVSCLLTTKSTNLPFVVVFFACWALLIRHSRGGTRMLQFLGTSFLVALVVTLPWALQNRMTAGTLFYPLLGKGSHVSQYGQVPTPFQVGNLNQMIAVALPCAVLLLALLICLWHVTRAFPPQRRAALLAFVLAALASVGAVTYGLGGEAVDRYTAPFVMPALLVALAIWLAPKETPVRRQWHWLTATALLCSVGYAILALGVRLTWYANDIHMLSLSLASKADLSRGYLFPLNEQQIQANVDHGRRLQRALPPGAKAIVDTQNSYIFDFSRNTIYLQDMAGMASPKPGIPLTGTPDDLRRYLLAQGVEYIIFDHAFSCPQAVDGSHLLDHLRIRPTTASLVLHPLHGHEVMPWSHVESSVSCRMRAQMEQVARQSTPLFEDKDFLIARI